MAAVSTIDCKSCGRAVRQNLMLCPYCSQDPRAEPASVGESSREHGDERLAESRENETFPVSSSSSSSGRVRLTLPNHEQIVIAPGQRVVLGRRSPVPVVAQAFPDGLTDVSRHHVRLANEDGVPVLIMLGDTGGQWGTFFNGEELENVHDARVPLPDGARFRLGKLAWCKVEVFS